MIKDFSRLANFISVFISDKVLLLSSYPTKLVVRFENALKDAEITNPWFTQSNIIFMLEYWSKVLTEQNLKSWIQKYSQTKTSQQKVAIIMAGNIPLVGFHDLLSVLIMGHKAIIKCSQKDTHLISALTDLLIYFNPKLKNRIYFEKKLLSNFDFVIATGSDNSSRYFEYYFRNRPSIIRKNRSSIAILDGNETPEELKLLGRDIFLYFGLGCRNVNKIYLPNSYDFKLLEQGFVEWKDVVLHHKYANNYNYYKTIYLMNTEKFFDFEFFILKQDKKLVSPISVLHFEFYSDEMALLKETTLIKHQLQCIVTNNNLFPNAIKFGQTQTPKLDDYADGKNTLELLTKN